MRIVIGLLAIAFLATAMPVTPVQAQCDPSICGNPGGWQAKSKAKKAAAKKTKKPAKEQYMRIAP
jgi:hypothetical protein